MQVALFVTCLVDQLAPETGRAAMRLLEAAGCDVVFPEAQTCCGQPAYNAGFPRDATRLARHFVDVFHGFDAVVAPSGSCTAMVKHVYPTLLAGRDRARADDIASSTYELSQYLVDVIHRPDLGARCDTTVSYHSSCHLLRELGVHDAPRKLLAAAGATVDELAEPERCCGFGGTFSMDHPEMAVPMADVKLNQAMANDTTTLVACDTGCVLHLRTRASQRGLSLSVRHLADVVAEHLP